MQNTKYCGHGVKLKIIFNMSLKDYNKINLKNIKNDFNNFFIIKNL